MIIFLFINTLQATVIDPTTVELQWNVLEGLSLPLHVELSWSVRAAGAGSSSHLSWETAPKMVGGNRVRKKNLAPGSVCHFRLRYGIVDTPSSAKGKSPTSTLF